MNTRMKLTGLIISLFMMGMLTPLCASGQTAKGSLPDDWTLPLARVTARILDEMGNPLSGAMVSLSFSEPRSSSSTVKKPGLTDTNGEFFGEGYSDGVLGTLCTKDGYYLGMVPIPVFKNAVDKRWQPWGATYTTVLRKIENPIPMYARSAVVKVPVQGKPCGYDLKEGDWVAPWGKGLIADFVFTAESRYTNYNQFDASMKLAFSSPLDGIQPANLPPEYAYSEFIWHRQAPETGYLPGYGQEKGMPGKHYQIPSAPSVRRLEDVENQKFYFRVRTVEKDGKIISALYGKLAAGFEMRIPNQQEVKIVLKYYLNPTPLDRNMEFDVKQNLFNNLKFDEQPRKP